MKAKRSGSHRRQWLFALLFLCPGLAHAALTASLDREAISMGETVRLTISSDSDADPSSVNLGELQRYFDILQRSSSVSTQIVNGQREQRRELVLEITPRAEGEFTIPPFRAGAEVSAPLSVTVSPQPQLATGDEIVFFEAEVDRERAYVQGQVLLTLRIQQSVTLDSRSVTELEIDDAVVKTLGQNSFQRTIDGRPWLVHEIRVAIFPQSSGELRIPEQTFSGRLSSGRRSLFDTRPTGRLIRRRTEEIVIEVEPRPASFRDPVWLPAADLMIEEQWSEAPDEIRVGDSITRSITVTARGLQGTQLPPLSMETPDGLRVYPDQPAINELDGENGVTGIRTDSLAIVAVRPGTYQLPPLTVRWWDTQADSPREGTLPGRTLRVLPAPVPADGAGSAGQEPGREPESSIPASSGSAGFWPWVAGFCAAGWLLTGLLAWRRPRRGPAAMEPAADSSATSRKALLQACRANDALLARQRLRQWLLAEGYRGTIEAWAAASGSPALIEALADLEQHLFATRAAETLWRGDALAAALKDAPAPGAGGPGKRDPLPPLYPAASWSSGT